MEVKLHVVRGNPKGKVLEVPEGALAIGRAESNDLIIASTRVSRNHCEVVNDGQSAILRDKGSSNGSFVNGERVNEQTLKPGDQVAIGPLQFIVEIDGRREPSEAGAAQPEVGAPATPPQAEPEAVSPSMPEAAPQAEPPAEQPAQPPAPQPPQGGGGPDDILSSLERMAGSESSQPETPQPPAPPAQGEQEQQADDDALRISDEDLPQES